MKSLRSYFENVRRMFKRSIASVINPIWGYVDLGLPSGTLWAKMNVGAKNEEDGGLYYSWGDIKGYVASQVGNELGKKKFSSSDYKYKDAKYAGIRCKKSTLTKLEKNDDVAYIESNGQYKIPTREQFEELLEYTYKKWDYERNGCLLISQVNGNSIFLPVNGSCYNSKVVGAETLGHYWSSTANVDKSTNYYRDDRAFTLYLTNKDVNVYMYGRYGGRSVRGVIS